LYRKCSASNRILAAKDHASIQINLAEVSLLHFLTVFCSVAIKPGSEFFYPESRVKNVPESADNRI
jgi:hypothetical protein